MLIAVPFKWSASSRAGKRKSLPAPFTGLPRVGSLSNMGRDPTALAFAYHHLPLVASSAERGLKVSSKYPALWGTKPRAGLSSWRGSPQLRSGHPVGWPPSHDGHSRLSASRVCSSSCAMAWAAGLVFPLPLRRTRLKRRKWLLPNALAA